MKSNRILTQIIHRGSKDMGGRSLLFICAMATDLSRMQDHTYGIDNGERSAYEWEYAHIEWRLNIEHILPGVITEINLNVKASMVEHVFGLLELSGANTCFCTFV